MSYKNDSNLVIANRFGDASGAAKAQLWETYDRLRDLIIEKGYNVKDTKEGVEVSKL